MSNPLPIIPGRLPAAPERYDRDNEAMTRRIIELALARGPTAVGSGPGTGETDVILDVTDRRESSATTGCSIFVGGSMRNAATAGIFWAGGIVSDGHPYAIHSGSGLSLRKSETGDGALTIAPEWPIFQRWSTLDISTTLITVLRYTFSCAVMRHAANAEIGIMNSAVPIDTDTNRLGYVLYDDGGVWGVKRRLAIGAASEDISPLVSLSSTVLRRFTMVYLEGEEPTLTLSLDGQTLYQAVGDAEMPEYPASGVIGYGPSVCENILTVDGRLLIEFVSRPA